MSLPYSLFTFFLLSRAGAAAPDRARRHIGWLVCMLTLISMAFNFPAQAQTLTTLVKFNRDNGGRSSGVALDSNGNLYGTTSWGGRNGAGTIWEIARGSSTITTLAYFNHYDRPISFDNRVTAISNGNLYGTTNILSYGGGYGAVWELVKGSRQISILASFRGSDGESPSGAILDSNGNLYGTTLQGGIKGSGIFSSGYGSVWEIVKGSHSITTLTQFRGSNGAHPSGGVSIDSNGNLYGTTYGDGANDGGTVWEISKGSRNITILGNFSRADLSHDNNGTGPSGRVALDSTGNLYGTTVGGGAKGEGVGTVWKIAKGSKAITALAYFHRTAGMNPNAGVTLDRNGNLFGTTMNGPIIISDGTVREDGKGTVWELVKGSNRISTLAIFNGENGAFPRESVILNSNGNLYGTTFGDINGFGTVFEVSGIPGTSHPPGLGMHSKIMILGVIIVLILGLGIHIIRDLRVRERLS